MLPFDSEPTSWQDLQNKVGQLFDEIGCTVRISERVSLVRGHKEIDVLATDSETAPSSIYAIECKNWSNRVPQEIAHSFRTVVSDLGAHHGFIVSREGFQAGAYEVVKNTNISLLTFTELQQLFVERWLASMAKRHAPLADTLFPYWDPSGGKRPPAGWGIREQESMHHLAEAYHPFVLLGPTLAYSGYRMKLPMTVPVLSDELAIVGTTTIETFRQFYDFVASNFGPALLRYRKLFREEG
jgi:hypothetical protein